MNMVGKGCHTEYDNIYQPDDLNKITVKILSKSNRSGVKELSNIDGGMPAVFIPSDYDTRLFSLSGKINKLRREIQSENKNHVNSIDTIHLYADIIPYRVRGTAKNEWVRTEPVPVFTVPFSGRQAAENPEHIIEQPKKRQFSVMTTSVVSPVCDNLRQTNNCQFSGNIQDDEIRPGCDDNNVQFQMDIGNIGTDITRKRSAGVNDIIPFLYTEKPLAEYHLVFSEHTDVQTKQRRDIPLPAQQPVQYDMDGNDTKAGCYFSYSFKMQGDYHEMIHIYRQQQRFILETRPEQLKRQLKANIRHEQKGFIDII